MNQMNLPITTLILMACSAPIVLDDVGGWCWFQDERCIVKDGVQDWSFCNNLFSK